MSVNNYAKKGATGTKAIYCDDPNLQNLVESLQKNLPEKKNNYIETNNSTDEKTKVIINETKFGVVGPGSLYLK